MGTENNKLIGMTLGTCTIQRLVGQGGMGAVYIAQQSRPRRTVAVKVLTPELFLSAAGSNEFLVRFRREADAIAALDHVNIMPIYEYGEQGQLAYLVMPYIAGGTLRDFLVKKGRFSVDEALPIVDQITAALDYAHRHGIIHRDLKPGNILLHSDGRLMLTDFGIAKVLNEQGMQSGPAPQTLTSTGAIMGTPEFLSPEQATGAPIDHRSDIYSFGVVLYQMLTGQVPFTGTTPVAVAIKHAMEEPPTLTSFNPTIPPEVEKVIFKALAKKPDQRYSSAGEFARALRAAVNASQGAPTLIPVVDEKTLISGTPQVENRSGETPAAVSTPEVAKSNPTTPQVAPHLQEIPTMTAESILAANQKTVASQVPVTPRPEAGQLSEDATPKARTNRLPLWIGIISVILVLALIGGGAFLYLNQSSNKGQSTNGSTATSTSQATATQGATATPSTGATATSEVTPTTGITPTATQGTLPKPSIPVGALLFSSLQPTCDQYKSQWTTNQYVQISCPSGVTELKHVNTGHWGATIVSNLTANQSVPSNYVLEVQVKSNNSQGSFGIIFRAQTGTGHQGGYAFLIQPSGYWTGYTLDDASGSESSLYGLGGFNFNSSGYNTLDIVVQNSSFSLYFNGQKQGGIQDGNYTSGGVGLMVDGGADTSFKNLGIYALP